MHGEYELMTQNLTLVLD